MAPAKATARLLTGALLFFLSAACGGGEPGGLAFRAHFPDHVSFGDTRGDLRPAAYRTAGYDTAVTLSTVRVLLARDGAVVKTETFSAAAREAELIGIEPGMYQVTVEGLVGATVVVRDRKNGIHVPSATVADAGEFFLSPVKPRRPVLSAYPAPITNQAALVLEGTKEMYTGVSLGGRTVVAPDEKKTFRHDVRLAEGANALVLAAVNRLDEPGETLALNVTLDTQPPAISLLHLSNSATAVSTTAVTLELRAEGASAMKLSESTDFTGAVWQPFSAAPRFTLSATPGLKTIYALVRDRAGNVSERQSLVVTYDTTPPPAPQVGMAGGAVYSRTRTVVLQVAAAGATEVLVQEAGTAAGAWQALATQVPFTVSAGDGPKSLLVRVRDAAGNISQASGVEVTLDATPPSTPGAPVFNANPVTGPVSFSWTPATDVTSGVKQYVYQYSADGGSVWGGNLVAVGTSAGIVLDFSGTYLFRVAAVDFAGSTGPWSVNSVPLVVSDSAPTAPGTPTFAANPVSGPTIVSWTAATDPGSNIELYQLETSIDGGTTWQLVLTTASTSGQLTPEVEGTLLVRVRAINALAVSGPYSTEAALTVDLTPPVLESISIGGGGFTNVPLITVTLPAFQALEYQLSEDPAFAGAVWAAFDPSPAFNLAPGDGSRTVYARVRDAVGHVSTVQSASVVLDTLSPGAPVGPSFSANPVSESVQINWSVVTDSGSGVEQYLVEESTDGVTFGSTLAVTGPTADIFYFLTSQTLYYRVQAVDRAGNAGSWSTVIGPLTVDRSPPSAPGVPALSTTLTNTSVSLTWDPAVDVDTAIVSYDIEKTVDGGATWFPLGSTAGTSFTYSVSVPGQLQFRVRARDQVGHVGAYSTSSAPLAVDLTDPVVSLFEINGTPAFVGMLSVDLNMDASDDTGVEQFEIANDAGFQFAQAVSYQTSYLGWALGGGDGVQTIYLRARDGAGNYSAVVSTTTILDTTPPASVANIGFSANPVSDTVTLTWSGGSDTGSGFASFNVERSDDGGATWGLFGVPTTPSFLEEAMVDGDYTYRIAAEDAVGNVGAPSLSGLLVVDTLEPVFSGAVSFSSNPVTGSVQLVWPSASDDRGTIAGYDVGRSADGGATWVYVARDLAGTSYIDTGIPAGEYMYRIRARDPAGNGTYLLSGLLTADDGPPPAPDAPVASATVTNSPMITVSWNAVTDPTGIANYDVEQTSDGGSIWNPVTTTASASIMTTLTDGVYGFRVRARDNSGQVSAWSSPSATVTVDTQMPDVVIDAPLPATWYGAGLMASGTATDFGSAGLTEVAYAVFDGALYYDGTGFSSGTPVWLPAAGLASWTADLSLLPPGSYTLEAQATDAAGNLSLVAQVSFGIDAAPPTCGVCATLTGDADTYATTSAVTLASDVVDDTTLEAMVTGDIADAFAGTWVAWEGTLGLTLTAGEGTKFVDVSFRDQAGNLSGPHSTSITFDETPPTAPEALSFTANPAGASYSVLWSASDGSWLPVADYEVERSVDGGASWTPLGTVVPTQYDETGMAHGTYVYRVRARDTLSRYSAFSLPATVSVDLQPPAVTMFDPYPQSYSFAPTVTGTAQDESALGVMQVEVNLSNGSLFWDGAAFTSPGIVWLAASGAESWSWPLPGLADGTYFVEARATDYANNIGAQSGPRPFTIDTLTPACSFCVAVEPMKGNYPFATETAVNLHFDVSGETGPVEMRITGDVTDPWAGTWVPYASPVSAMLTAGDGVKTVYAEFRDAAFNATGVYFDSVTLDTAGPSLFGITLAGGAVAVSEPTISLALSDSGGAALLAVTGETVEFQIRPYAPFTTTTLAYASAATFYNSGQAELIYDGVLQSDGKLVVAGSRYNGADGDMLLARFTPNGTLDAGFGAGGIVSLDIGGTNAADYAYAVTVQTDGRIVVAGSSGPSAFVARFTQNGSLDTLFSGDGKHFQNGGISSYFSAVQVQADGRILAAGTNVLASNENVYLMRFNTDGTPDNAFGSLGIAEVDLSPSSIDRAYGLALQADGRIVIAGRLDAGTSFVARLQSGGALDTSFNGTGVATMNPGGQSLFNEVAVQDDGFIVAVGQAQPATQFDATVARFTPEGGPDNGFADNGLFIHPFSAAADYAVDLSIDEKGIVVAGYGYGNGNDDYLVFRLRPNGQLDDKFGTQGHRWADMSGGTDNARAMVRLADGRMALIGDAAVSGNQDLVIAQLLPDGRPDGSYGMASDSLKTVWVRIADEAGNWSDPVSAAIDLDRAPPGGGIALPASATDALVSVNLLATDANGPIEMMLSGDITDPFRNTWIGYQSNITLTTTAGRGTKTVTVRFRDALGNTGPVKSDSTLLDVPESYTLGVTSGTGNEVVLISGAGYGALQGTGYVDIGGFSAIINSWSDTTIEFLVPEGVPAGPRDVMVVRDDGLDANLLPFDVRPSIISDLSGVVTGGDTFVASGTNFEAGLTATLDGNPVSISAVYSNEFHVTVDTAQEPGSWPLVATVNGRESNPYFIAIRPNIVSLDLSSAAGGDVVTITGHNFGAALGTVLVDAAPVVASYWDNTTITFTLPNETNPGSRVVMVEAGGEQSNTWGLNVAMTLVSALPNFASGNEQIAISGANFGATQGTVEFDGSPLSIVSWTSTVIEALLPPEPEAGPGTLSVTEGYAFSTTSMAYTMAARITEVTPVTVTPDDMIVIRGTNFGAVQGANTVDVGGISAGILFWGTREIQATVPNGIQPGTRFVSVDVAGAPSNTVALTVKPEVNYVSPGPGATGGENITISGAAFGDVMGSVTVGGISAPVASWSNYSISATVPTSVAAGWRDVVVTAAGQASPPWSYAIKPGVTALSPATGPVGTVVQILGHNFGPPVTGNAVEIYGVSVTPDTWTDTQITFTVPPLPNGLASVAVIVDFQYSQYLNFNVVPGVPVIDSAPATSQPNDTVIILGSHFGDFQGDSQVFFGGSQAFVNSWSDTSLEVVMPPYAAPGTLEVWVRTAGGESNRVPLEHQRPWIDHRYPLHVSDGGTVTLVGRYFGPDDPLNAIEAGGYVQTPIAWSPTAITFAISTPTGGVFAVRVTPSGNGMSNDVAVHKRGNDQWIPLTDGLLARTAHSAVWTGAEMIVWGGAMGSYEVNTGGRYNPLTDTWTPTKNSEFGGQPSPRRDHSAVWSGEKMLIFGGYGGGLHLDDLYAYDPATDVWETLPTNPSGGRSRHAAVWTGRQMVVIGGTNGSPLSAVSSYDPGTYTWGSDLAMAAPREGHIAVWTGKEILVHGGGEFSPGSALEIIDPFGWTIQSGPDSLAPRSGHVGVWTGSELIVWGGTDAGRLNSGERFDGTTWSAIESSPLVARTGHTAVWDGSAMVVWGGEDDGGTFRADGARYEPGIGWSLLPTAGAPAGRRGHTALWTGVEMLVWGGEAGSAASLHLAPFGARYNPQADVWNPVSNPESIAPRMEHSALWTGAEMIVWGGMDAVANSVLSDGARFLPASNTWMPIAATGPTGRTAHTAVWAADRMLIFGGWLGAVPIGEGWSYAPDTDSWTPLPGTNAPSSRGNHSAVWTGTDMIVWGGMDNGFTEVGDGARFHVASDQWYPLGTTGAPEARYDHAAVWAGDRMLVWGGRNSFVLNTGAYYDPAQDAWFATPLTAVPEARLNASAVWTGSEVLIWGGSNNVSSHDTGARWDPAGNAWTAMSTVFPPAARERHAAVWAGTAMVVYGGVDLGSTHYGDGGVYDPVQDTWTMLPWNNLYPRADASAVWTGSEVIVFGGGNSSVGVSFSDGAMYLP